MHFRNGVAVCCSPARTRPGDLGSACGSALLRVDFRQRGRHSAHVLLPGASDGSESDSADDVRDLGDHWRNCMGTGRSAMKKWGWLLSMFLAGLAVVDTGAAQGQKLI